MDENGQVYVDVEERIPKEDVERYKRALMEHVDEDVKPYLERAAQGPTSREALTELRRKHGS